jgi:hypothetical protein
MVNHLNRHSVNAYSIHHTSQRFSNWSVHKQDFTTELSLHIHLYSSLPVLSHFNGWFGFPIVKVHPAHDILDNIHMATTITTTITTTTTNNNNNTFTDPLSRLPSHAMYKLDLHCKKHRDNISDICNIASMLKFGSWDKTDRQLFSASWNRESAFLCVYTKTCKQ